MKANRRECVSRRIHTRLNWNSTFWNTRLTRRGPTRAAADATRRTLAAASWPSPCTGLVRARLNLTVRPHPKGNTETMTNRETRAMLLCSVAVAILLTAETQIQYWYQKVHHLLRGPLAVDSLSIWWTEHMMWLITLFFGWAGGCFIYFVFWVVRSLLSRKDHNRAA